MFFVKSLETVVSKKGVQTVEWVEKEICLMQDDFHVFEKNAGSLKIDYERFFDRQVIEPLQEFIYSERVKSITKQYMENHPDFYKKFFKRVDRVSKTIKLGKPLTVGIFEWVNIWDSMFGFSKNGKINLKT